MNRGGHEFNTQEYCPRCPGVYHYSCDECGADCTMAAPGGPATLDTNGRRRCAACQRQHEARRLVVDLPPEFIALCERDGTTPATVLRGFIADLCGLVTWAHPDPAAGRPERHDGYSTNGSDERMMARDYYDRVGYPWHRR